MITFAGPCGQPFDLILKITDALVALGNRLVLVGSPGSKFFDALLCGAEEIPQLLDFAVVVLCPCAGRYGILITFAGPCGQPFDLILKVTNALVALGNRLVLV